MKEFYINSPADGLRLAVAIAEPEAAPSGIIQFVHGMCEHKERYYELMEWFASKGWLCIIHDHRGHGASVKSPEDLGYMYEGGWAAMVEDIKAVGDWARGEYQGLEFVLFGHSMGSLAVRSYAKRWDDTIDRLFVCGSPSDNPAKGAGSLLAGLIGRVRGWHCRPNLLQSMSFGAYNKPFAGECDASGRPYHSAWVCSDRKILDAYHSDPLCQYVFTANGFSNLLKLMADCYSPKGWRMARPSLPVCFLSGGDDPCRMSDKAFDKAVKAMEKVGYTSVDAITYPGMRHEILNETEKLTVWGDILRIISA